MMASPAQRESDNGFVAPRPQPALGGESGLTAHEIARSLGVEPKVVLKKLRRDKWLNSPKWWAVPYVTSNSSNGTKATGFALNTRAAKAFVARWASDLGDAYLDYLFDCEEVVERSVPKMATEIAKLRSQIDALTTPQTRCVKGTGVVEFIKSVVTRRTIFGEPESFVTTAKKVRRELTPDEVDAYKVQHCARVMRGQAVCVKNIVQKRNQSARVTKLTTEITDLAHELHREINMPGAQRVANQPVILLLGNGNA